MYNRTAELPLKLVEAFHELRLKETDPDSCWEWPGYLRDGYGRVNARSEVDGRRRSWITGAHRLSYLINVGDIPEGLWIDHLCRNRSCYNPAHLEPVTPAENQRRGMRHDWLSIKPREPARPRDPNACVRGHPMTPENTYPKMSRGNLVRECRICRRARKSAYKKRLRSAA